MHFSLITFFILLNIFVYFNINWLIKKFNIFDKPDKNKIHKKKISLIGGTILFINIFIFLICYKINFLNYFSYNKEFISFFIIITGFYLVGLYDDKYQVSPSSRIVLMTFILYVSITLNNSLLISKIDFSFFNNKFYFNDLSIFFTIICILIFTYALNMFDGVNLQSITYCTLIFCIFFFLSKFETFYLIIIICLLFLFILNLKNTIFLGDSGIYILGGFISFVVITEYNKQSIKFFADDIFILMMVPGLDFIRIFIERISKGKNPFLGDKNHLHHLLLSKFGFLKSYLLIVLLYGFIFLLKLINISNAYIIMFYIIFYNILYLYLKKILLLKKYN
jgi:UDP-GlcNAc:undecaprenyl-phosphate GlcNAc-1-phosphate transferase